MSTFAYLFKFIVVGDTSVGKTCLSLRFIRDDFEENYNVTVGADFGSKIVNIESEQIKLQIWDTAGQESFRSLTRSYYRAAAAAFLVFDVSRRETFINAINWLQDLHTYCGNTVLICLLGNKSDLPDDEREISKEEAAKFASQNNLLYIETSAKTGENVEKAFLSIAQNLYSKIMNKEILVNESTQGIKVGVSLQMPEIEVVEKKSSCC